MDTENEERKKDNEIVISDREFATGFLCYVVVVVVVQCIGCMYGVETVKMKTCFPNKKRSKLCCVCFFILRLFQSRDEMLCYLGTCVCFFSFGYLILFFCCNA